MESTQPCVLPSSDGEVEALSTADILTKIFKFCNENDRKNFRLVCTGWFEATLALWRSSTVLQLCNCSKRCRLFNSGEGKEENRLVGNNDGEDDNKDTGEEDEAPPNNSDDAETGEEDEAPPNNSDDAETGEEDEASPNNSDGAETGDEAENSNVDEEVENRPLNAHNYIEVGGAGDSINSEKNEESVRKVDNVEESENHRNRRSLHRFLQVRRENPDFLKLSTIPHRRIKLIRWNFNIDETRNTSDFWNFCGQAIQHLEIFGSSMENSKMIGDAFFQRVPNLESFTMSKNLWFWSFSRFFEDPRAVRCLALRKLKLNRAGLDQERLTDILRHFPNLVEFEMVNEQWQIYGRRFSSSTNMYNFLQAIHQMRLQQPQITHNIHTLKLMDTIVGPIRSCTHWRQFLTFEQFVAARLPLRNLEVDLGERQSARGARNVLLGHTETLEVFKGFRPPTTVPWWSFAVGLEMNAMRELYLWGHITQHFGFLKSMPNLKIFKLQKSCFEMKSKMAFILDKRYKFYWNQCYVENTKKLWINAKEEDTREDGSPVGMNLEYFEVDFEFGKKSVRAISRWMPNLKEIKFIVNQAALKIVVKRWPNLEALTLLFGSDLNDDGVVNKLVKLKKLKQFCLQTYCDESKLTDACVTDGFLKMESLEDLRIGVSPNMSKNGEIQLRNHIHKVRIIRNYGKHLGVCCELREFESLSIQPPSDRQVVLRNREVAYPLLDHISY